MNRTPVGVNECLVYPPHLLELEVSPLLWYLISDSSGRLRPMSHSHLLSPLIWQRGISAGRGQKMSNPFNFKHGYVANWSEIFWQQCKDLNIIRLEKIPKNGI